jgi:glycosyltransferase involved in cell wall biosynthesis
MQILFVHQNYPAQYLHVAPALAARGHDIRVITDRVNSRPDLAPTERYGFKDTTPQGTHPLAVHFAGHVQRGQVVAQTAANMRAGGYVPDIICGHLGWGETLFLKDVWPEAKLLVHAEFFYKSHGGDVGFDREVYPTNLNSQVRVRSRQASLLLAMHSADRAQTPTRWQANVFPVELQGKLRVVHEGIKTDLCRPDPTVSIQLKNGSITLKPGDEVIAFINRNLEPYRGYHIFMRALPKILAARPKARVIIVGGDEISYGGAPDPALGPTWREIYFREVKDRLDLSRVHFVGKIPYNVFINLLQVSAVHPYLTYPFVLSWSMLESMSCEGLVIGSRTPPVEEVITDGVNGKLVDFFDVDGWSEAIIDALANQSHYKAMRAEARRTVVERYDLTSICLPQQIELVESMLS